MIGYTKNTGQSQGSQWLPWLPSWKDGDQCMLKMNMARHTLKTWHLMVKSIGESGNVNSSGLKMQHGKKEGVMNVKAGCSSLNASLKGGDQWGA